MIKKNKVILMTIISLALVSVGTIGFSTWITGIIQTEDKAEGIGVNVDISENQTAYLDVSVASNEVINIVETKADNTADGIKFTESEDLKNDFDICISLDGNQKNDSYRIDKRKNETFYEVIKNIDTIYNSYPHFFKNNISFSTVIHNRNSIIEAGIFFDKYQKVPLFSFLSTSGLKKKNLKDFQKINCSKKYTYEEINIFRKEYPQLYNLFYKKSKDSIYEWGSYNNLKDMNDIFNKDKYIYPGGSCLLFQNKAFITINGDLLLCEKSFRKFKFGKISASKIVVYTQRVNKYYTQITHIFSKKCSGCYKFFSCSECYFSSEEAIINKQCFCHKEQARKEMQEIVNSIEE